MFPNTDRDFEGLRDEALEAARALAENERVISATLEIAARCTNDPETAERRRDKARSARLVADEQEELVAELQRLRPRARRGLTSPSLDAKSGRLQEAPGSAGRASSGQASAGRASAGQASAALRDAAQQEHDLPE